MPVSAPGPWALPPRQRSKRIPRCEVVQSSVYAELVYPPSRDDFDVPAGRMWDFSISIEWFYPVIFETVTANTLFVVQLLPVLSPRQRREHSFTTRRAI